MDVGVREFKQHLSEYLRRVEAGETIRITDRGTPKAVVSPIAGPQRLQVGVDEGWIRPPLREGALGTGRRYRAHRRSGDVLREDREA